MTLRADSMRYLLIDCIDQSLRIHVACSIVAEPAHARAIDSLRNRAFTSNRKGLNAHAKVFHLVAVGIGNSARTHGAPVLPAIGNMGGLTTDLPTQTAGFLTTVSKATFSAYRFSVAWLVGSTFIATPIGDPMPYRIRLVDDRVGASFTPQ
jgi:hypothetical protein